jgi:hypothetical protein
MKNIRRAGYRIRHKSIGNLLFRPVFFNRHHFKKISSASGYFYPIFFIKVDMISLFENPLMYQLIWTIL